MALFLRDEDVRQIVTMEQMLAAIESMQDHFGRGEAYNLARRKINVSGGKFSVMGGGLFYDGVVGAKTYTYINGTYSFHVSLYDAETGKLLCDTQSNRLGQLRTGATTGVAVKYLSNPDAATLGIIGTGYQAPTQLEVVCKVRNIRKIKAYSRTSDKRASFAGSMTEALGIEVISAENTQQTVSGSDVVICIAATKKPVLEGHWLAPGMTIIGAGPTTWRVQEVDGATVSRADKIFVDIPEQVPSESGEMAAMMDRGLLYSSQLLELRHAVAGMIPGRDGRDQVVYAKLMGSGVADVAAAKLAYDRARAEGVGLEMDW